MLNIPLTKPNPDYEPNHYFKVGDPQVPNFIFDDPRLKNYEMDVISFPIGSGQGFRAFMD